MQQVLQSTGAVRLHELWGLFSGISRHNCISCHCEPSESVNAPCTPNASVFSRGWSLRPVTICAGTKVEYIGLYWQRCAEKGMQ